MTGPLCCGRHRLWQYLWSSSWVNQASGNNSAISTYSRSSIFFTSLGGKDLQATFDRYYWRIHRHYSRWGAVTNVNGIGEGTEVTSAGKVAIMNDGGSIPIPMLCN